MNIKKSETGGERKRSKKLKRCRKKKTNRKAETRAGNWGT